MHAWAVCTSGVHSTDLTLRLQTVGGVPVAAAVAHLPLDPASLSADLAAQASAAASAFHLTLNATTAGNLTVQLASHNTVRHHHITPHPAPQRFVSRVVNHQKGHVAVTGRPRLVSTAASGPPRRCAFPRLLIALPYGDRCVSAAR